MPVSSLSSLRVTNQSTSRQVNESLQQAFRRLSKVQEAITSGKRINHLADDPVGAVRVLDLRSTEASLDQYDRNTNSALLSPGADRAGAGRRHRGCT
jgi:flagellar hook-associated protein 3 FlgL